MTETPIGPGLAALEAAVPGLETALRDAATRAMMPELPPQLALGFFQVVVSMARTIRQ